MTPRRAFAGFSLVTLPAFAALIGSIAPGPSAHAAVPAAGDLPVPGKIASDTVEPVPPDTLVTEEEQEVRLLPEPARPIAAGWRTGIWEWDREALESTRALTLLELLEQIPGVTPLRGGDYGQPSSATAFGVGAGRVRIFLDGAEMPPLDGGAVDLARIGLSGIGGVRVERRGGELRVEMSPLQLTDGRPYTLLEVGTGDLNTNLFRGTFGHPDALGGSIVVSLDRVDTQGPLRREPGASMGGHVRHTLFQGGRGGVAWEYRRMTSRRPAALWPPGRVGRSDLALHGRYEVAPGLLASAFAHRASLDGDPEGEASPELQNLVDEAARTQIGGRLSLVREGWWAEAEARWNRGPARPGSSLGLAGGGTVPGLGGTSASIEREGWDEGSGIMLHGRIWSAPLAGLSLFGEVEDGRRGVPLVPRTLDEVGDPDAVVPMLPFSFDDRTYLRAGVEYRRGDLHVGVAGVQVRADSLHPVGLAWDREGEVLFGGSRNALEVSGLVPLRPLLNGLALEGTVQLWDPNDTWRYVPQESYQGAVRYQDVFLESENLEVWLDVGVRGRSAMALPFTADPLDQLLAVPSQQTWYGFLQIRITSAKLFFAWDNFTLREANQDFPDRRLPATRMMYGIRWTMWN